MDRMAPSEGADAGSIPAEGTKKFSLCSFCFVKMFDEGPIVKWYNASMAWTRAGSDSPWVHI